MLDLYGNHLNVISLLKFLTKKGWVKCLMWCWQNDSKKDYHFVNIITNIWQCKMMLWFQEYRDFMQQSVSKFWINLVYEFLSAQVSFGSYLNSLFKTTIVSFILQFLTHNSPEHGCDALNCTLWLMLVMLLWFCSQVCKWIGMTALLWN